MSDVKISALPLVTVPAGSDIIPVVQGGVTKQETATQLLNNTNTAIANINGEINAINSSLLSAAYKSDNLSVFAATTSAQFASVISDEIGSGPLAFSTKAIVTITGSTVLDATHWARHLIFNSASAITITLPQQSTLVTAAGINFSYENIGAGLVTFAKQGAETLSGNLDAICATNGSGFVWRDTTTDWFIKGGTAVCFGTYKLTVQTVGNVTYNIERMAGAGTITALHSICRSGTCTATWAINASNITATANAVSTTNQNQSATAANTFVAGDYLNVTASANSTCLDMCLTADYTYMVNI